MTIAIIIVAVLALAALAYLITRRRRADVS